MGRRNPERIPITEYRRAVATVADMQREGWEVVSKCLSCGLMMLVDLDLIAWKLGSKTVLWNRRPHCKRIGCQGRVQFQAKPPMGPNHYQALETGD